MSSEGKSKDSDKSKAREAFANLVANLWNEERTSYEESYDLEDADEIPIDQLEEHNYKDLRVMDLYFSPDDSDTDSGKDKKGDEKGKSKDDEDKGKSERLKLFKRLVVEVKSEDDSGKDDPDEDEEEEEETKKLFERLLAKVEQEETKKLVEQLLAKVEKLEAQKRDLLVWARSSLSFVFHAWRKTTMRASWGKYRYERPKARESGGVVSVPLHKNEENERHLYHVRMSNARSKDDERKKDKDTGSSKDGQGHRIEQGQGQGLGHRQGQGHRLGPRQGQGQGQVQGAAREDDQGCSLQVDEESGDSFSTPENQEGRAGGAHHQ